MTTFGEIGKAAQRPDALKDETVAGVAHLFGNDVELQCVKHPPDAKGVRAATLSVIPKDGLCAIVCKAEHAETWIAMNPVLTRTLTITTSATVTYWVRIQGTYPTSKQVEIGRWCAEEPVTVFCQMNNHQITNPVKPIVIPTAEFVWPPFIFSSFVAEEVTREFGNPAVESHKGIVWNYRFLAAYYARLCLVTYEKESGKFLKRDAAQHRWVEISQPALMQHIANFVGQLSALDISALLEPRNLRKLVNLIRANPPSDVRLNDTLRKFLQYDIKPEPGCSVTMNELVEAYQIYAGSQGITAIPDNAVRRLIKPMMNMIHRISMSKSVQRDGKNVRGFRNVKLTPGAAGALGAFKFRQGLAPKEVVLEHTVMT